MTNPHVEGPSAFDAPEPHCADCGSTDVPLSKDLHVHHIVKRSQGGSDETENLIALCAGCHRNVHDTGLLETSGTASELTLQFYRFEGGTRTLLDVRVGR